MAIPSVEPVLHVIVFDSREQAQRAHVAVTTAPWTLIHEERSYACRRMTDSRDAGPTTVWETTPEDMALSGMAGPSGFGIGVCDFVGDATVVVRETMTVHISDVDYDSLRSYLDVAILLEQ